MSDLSVILACLSCLSCLSRVSWLSCLSWWPCRHRAARAVKKLHDVCHISNINKTPRSLFLPSLLKITSPLTFCSSIVLLLRIQVSDCLVIPIMSFLFVLATDKTILGPWYQKKTVWEVTESMGMDGLGELAAVSPTWLSEGWSHPVSREDLRTLRMLHKISVFYRSEMYIAA